MTDRVAYVYALTDPAGWVRYVGQSSDPWRRLSNHYAAGANLVRSWLADLESRGEKPGVVILQAVPEGAGIDEIERLWIERFATIGAPLLNRTWAPVVIGKPITEIERAIRVRRESRGSQALKRAVGRRGGQSALARELGTKQSIVCRWVSGERKPDSRGREALHKLFGIEWSWWEETAARAEVA